MQPKSEFDAPSHVSMLLRRSRSGALASLMAADGGPYCSLVNVASDFDGSPILLISRLAIHTSNVRKDARVSLMLDDRTPGDPLEGSRIMMQGRLQEFPRENDAALRERYLGAHPDAAGYAQFTDFSFWKLVPERVHLVAGFGRILDLMPSEFLTDVTSAEELIAASQDAIAHMNEDHRDTMNLYAVGLLGAQTADWRCSGIDPDGIDLVHKREVLRLRFTRRVCNPAALRKELRALADMARAKKS